MEAFLGLGGDRDGYDITAVLLDEEIVLGQLMLNPIRVGAREVSLIDGNDDGDTGCLGVVNRFQGLGHNAVVGGDHQDSDVGNGGSPSSQGREGLMAGGVDEGYLLSVNLHLRGANMLGGGP